MPLVNYVWLHADDIAKHLEPGERLIDMGPYSEPHIGDDSKLERTIDELGPRMQARLRETGQSPPPPSDRLYEGFSFFGGGIQLNQDIIDRWMGGIDGIGEPTSIAGQLWRATRRETRTTTYAVTTHRLLILVEPEMNTFDIVFEVPRHQVVSAELRGKLLFQRGRVEVRFADGSMKAWTPGMVFATRGRMLVAALTGTQQEG